MTMMQCNIRSFILSLQGFAFGRPPHSFSLPQPPLSLPIDLISLKNAQTCSTCFFFPSSSFIIVSRNLNPIYLDRQFSTMSFNFATARTCLSHQTASTHSRTTSTLSASSSTISTCYIKGGNIRADVEIPYIPFARPRLVNMSVFPIITHYYSIIKHLECFDFS